MTTRKPAEPANAERIRSFAQFFKSYMSVSAIVAAALPIPVASFKLIPTFAYQTKYVTVYTSMFCFLLLGFIFYSRHSLARLLFPAAISAPMTSPERRGLARIPINPITWLPLWLILASLTCVFTYHQLLRATIVDLHETEVQIQALKAQAAGKATPVDTGRKGVESHAADVLEHQNDLAGSKLDAKILEETSAAHIGATGPFLTLTYLGIFLFAEAAFIVMAIKEYLQDKLTLDDVDLMLGHGKSIAADLERAVVPSSPDTTTPAGSPTQTHPMET
jgi:hypothetical protein